MHNLFKNAKAMLLTTDGTNYTNATGVDSGYVYSTVVDTKGYQGVAFVFIKGGGTNAGTHLFKVQHDDDAAMGSVADVTLPSTTLQTLTDSGGDKMNRLVIYDIGKPTKRYMRLASDRSDQNQINLALLCILYNPSWAAPAVATTVGNYAATPIFVSTPANA